MPTAARTDARVERVSVAAYRVPTDAPEADGTLAWDATTLVVVEAAGGGATGLGYTYGHEAAATLVASTLAPLVEGADALAPPAAWGAMRHELRNVGTGSACALALSAVDIALWDLKARLLGVPLADLLPRHHAAVPAYGSGGFTSYSDERLRAQLAGWAEDGLRSVKLKVGREPARDAERVRAARAAVGPGVALMADANGAWTRKQALAWAERLAEHGVVWLEEPVSSDDLEGLRLVRERGPAGMDVAAGEYAWQLADCARLLDAGAVDVLQADVSRCGGITDMLRVDALCRARHVPFSAHCVPAVSAHACCAMETAVHVEWFHDHARIEAMLFDGAPAPGRDGMLRPDRERPGLGLELRRADAERYAL